MLTIISVNPIECFTYFSETCNSWVYPPMKDIVEKYGFGLYSHDGNNVTIFAMQFHHSKIIKNIKTTLKKKDKITWESQESLLD